MPAKPTRPLVEQAANTPIESTNIAILPTQRMPSDFMSYS